MRPKKKSKEIELEPDAWTRFERFIESVSKAGPQHRAHPKGKRRTEAKGRARKAQSKGEPGR